MSFSEILKDSVAKVNGAVSALVIGTDGISVHEYISEKSIDLTGLSAEASTMIKDITMVAESLGLGVAREFSIVSDKFSIILRRINPEYYVAMVLKPGANFGKGRFILKMSVPKLEKEF
ncbi:MAG: roadblock/LC7 domain-containing protein [Nitrospira sp.]|nr:roadblock/LC7 domain-containing protein [Nitrospira sp.]